MSTGSKAMAAVTVGFFSMLVNLSALVFGPLLVVEVNGLSAGAAGLVLTPGAAAMAILSPLTGRLSDRVGVRLPIVTGIVIMALSVLFLSTFAGASSVLISAGMLGLGIGFSSIQSPAYMEGNLVGLAEDYEATVEALPGYLSALAERPYP